MPIYELTPNTILPILPTNFSKEKIKERDDLQRILRDQIFLIAEDIMVLAEEFSDWSNSNRSIDLLCLDTDANLVVMELKRTTDGGHMELQALRYTAMISTMTFDQAVTAHQQYLQMRGKSDDARSTLLTFLGWEEPNEESFAADVRIILVSEGFSREITTTVMWLNERNLDIRCVRLSPYRSGERILLDIQQVIPLPEAADFQVRIREKAQRKRSGSWKPKTIPAIWAEFEHRCTPRIVATARDLYDWFLEEFDEVFPTTNAFAPMMHDKKHNQFFLKVMYLGDVEVWFCHLANKSPFDSERHRENLRLKLNEIEGVNIPNDRLAGKPTFPIDVLVNPENRDKFKAVMTWARDLVRNDGAGVN